MVLGSVLDEWRQRLAALEQQAAVGSADRDLELWLVRLRVRILTFLVSRYGDTVEPPPRRRIPLRRAPRPPAAGRAWDGVEVPPLDGRAMSPVLRRLRSENVDIRLRTGVGADPESVWRWFAARFRDAEREDH